VANVINIADLTGQSEAETIASVRDAGAEFVLEVPLASVNHTQSRLDVALDFLHALYIGETLHPLCAFIAHSWSGRDVRKWDDRRPEVASHFLVRPRNPTAFALALHGLASWFDPGDSEELDMEKIETLDGYQDRVKELLGTDSIHFPELADEYAKNFRLAEEADEVE
jgi:hypothetical protein